MDFCLFCDKQLSGFEHDVCVDCLYYAEQDEEDIEEEIKKFKEEQNGSKFSI